MPFVELEEARDASGLRLVVVAGVPSPWSQAARGILHIKGIDPPIVKMGRDPAVTQWTGLPNAPVAMFDGELPRSGWAEILALVERIQPEPRLIPEDPEQRVRMHGLSQELMGEGGIAWNARVAAIATSLDPSNDGGWPAPVAQYLAQRYGDVEDGGASARRDLHASLAVLDAQLERSAPDGPYYFGASLSALDIYSVAVIDALAILPDVDCPMKPSRRSAFLAMGAGVDVPPRLIEHRDMIHARHIPLPLLC